jgi:hypothetical protein
MYVTAQVHRRSTQELIGNTGMGAAFGTAKAGIGIAGIGTYRPDLIMKVRQRERHLEATANGCTVSHPNCHVRYLGCLRPRNIGPHRQRHQAPAREELLAICWVLPHGCWPICRAIRLGCGLCDWNRRRRSMLHHCYYGGSMLTLIGCALVHATVEDLCWHGVDSHFCRSPGSLWVSTPLLPY